MLYFTSLGLAATLLCLSLIYYTGDRPLSRYWPISDPVFRFVFGVSLASPNRWTTAISVLLWRLLPSKYFNGWTLALVFVLTASVSLWALENYKEVDREQPDHGSAVSTNQWSAAMGMTLEPSIYRLLYLFHFSPLPFKETSGREVLLELPSSVMLPGALLYAVPWDASEYSVAQRAVFFTVCAFGTISTAVLTCRFVKIVSTRMPKTSTLECTSDE